MNSQGKVVNLFSEEVSYVICMLSVDKTIMNCSLEVKLFGTKNLIDVMLIDLIIFRMTLKVSENKKNMRIVYTCIVTLRPLVSIYIINSKIRWASGLGLCTKAFLISPL